MKTEELVEFLEELGFIIQPTRLSLTFTSQDGFDYCLGDGINLSKREVIQIICRDSYELGYFDGERQL